MLQWLRNRLAERQRLIFRYWDGRRIHRGDPLVLYRGLKNHEEFDYDSHLAAHDNGDDDATAVCARAVCDVFGVEPLSDEGGLTENERLALLKTFTEYVLGLKKSTSPPPTMSTPTSGGPEESERTTSLPAGSTSTSAEQSSGTPAVSLRA